MRAALAALLSFAAYRVARVRRDHVVRSIQRAGLPGRAARGMYAELATSLMELVWVACGWLSPADVVLIPDETVAAIKAARARGPVMLWCAHTSNWELLAMRAAMQFPLALIVKRQGVGMADRFIQHQRARFGLHTFHPEGAIREARAASERGDVVATVIDQVPARREHGDVVSFLGAPALVDRAPAVLAKKIRAHVFVIFASREKNRVPCDVEATHALSFTPQMVRELSARELISRATTALDAHVRSHPTSWLWLHRRWRIAEMGVASPARGARSPATGSTKTFLPTQKEVIESTS